MEVDEAADVGDPTVAPARPPGRFSTPVLTVLLSLLGPALALTGAPEPAPRRAAVVLQDPVQRVQVWTERGRRSHGGLDDAEMQELVAALGELRLLERGAPERRAEIDAAYLDLAALRWIPGESATDEARGRLDAMSELGMAELERRFRGAPHEVAAWLADEVLDPLKDVPEERRLAATALLRGRYLDGTQTALLRTARTGSGELRESALSALAGWPDPAVTLFFLESIGEPGWGLAPLVEHLDKTRTSLGPLALDQLRQICGRLYVSEDWRNAARARYLVRYLDTHRAVPLLIEALNVWDRRREDGKGSKRILYEVLDELQRVSGRAIGPVPGRWLAWWQAVLDGRVELPEEIEEAGGFVSRPAFFGLRPVSDRVIFLVDASGSMEWTFGTAGRERYAEAVSQLIRFVEQSGPETRFGIVLFNDDGVRWRSGLNAATAANVARAEKWLRKKRPGGGTNLYAGLQKALRLDRGGRIDLDRVDADTVIVLCDGETAEGSSWVRPWLSANNEAAQLVFHCVQIGSGGDGTLEALAEGTGGDFVRFEN